MSENKTSSPKIDDAEIDMLLDAAESGGNLNGEVTLFSTPRPETNPKPKLDSELEQANEILTNLVSKTTPDSNEQAEQSSPSHKQEPESMIQSNDYSSRIHPSVIKESILLTPAKLKELLPKLSEPLPEEAIQEGETRNVKGYDTTGYRYQYIFNHLNEVLPGGPCNWRILNPKIIQLIKSRNMYDATVQITFQIGNTVMYTDGRAVFYPLAEAEGFGGSVNPDLHASIVGAFTNACKKVIALLGPGSQAYTGELERNRGPANSSDNSQRFQPNNQRQESSQSRSQRNHQRQRSNDNPDALTKEPERAAEGGWPIITFGKYSGKSLYEVYKLNPTYVVEYLAKQINDKTNETWKRAINVIVQRHWEKQENDS